MWCFYVCWCHLKTLLPGCWRVRSERRSGPPPSWVQGKNCTVRGRSRGELRWYEVKIKDTTNNHYCVFTHHKTAHAPVSELWAKEVVIFLHLQAFLRAGSGVGRDLMIVFSSLKEHADPPMTRSVDLKSMTSFYHRGWCLEFTWNPACSCVQCTFQTKIFFKREKETILNMLYKICNPCPLTHIHQHSHVVINWQLITGEGVMATCWNNLI